jgi:sugar/nucleoside kinase (ribokinase family)
MSPKDPRSRASSGNSDANARRTRGKGTHPSESNTPRVFVVDRREGDRVILVSDGDAATVEIDADELPEDARAEGAVLQVPMTATGEPDWPRAVRDRDEESRRRAALAKRIAKLRRSDPGGDIVL